MPTVYRLNGNNDYTNTSYWSGGAVPADGDSVLFVDVFGDIDTGMAHSAINLAALVVGPNAAPNIGRGAAGPLVTNCDYLGAGVLTYEAGGGSLALTGTFNTAHCRPAGGVNASLIFAGTCQVDSLNVAAGNVTLGSAAVCTNFYATGPCVTIIEDNATGFTLAKFLAGKHVLRRGATALYVSGSADVTFDAPGRTITTLYQDGGTFRHVEGTITTDLGTSGTRDQRGLRKATTTNAGTYTEAMLIYQPVGAVAVTVTTETSIGRGAVKISGAQSTMAAGGGGAGLGGR